MFPLFVSRFEGGEAIVEGGWEENGEDGRHCHLEIYSSLG